MKKFSIVIIANVRKSGPQLRRGGGSFRWDGVQKLGKMTGRGERVGEYFVIRLGFTSDLQTGLKKLAGRVGTGRETFVQKS